MVSTSNLPPLATVSPPATVTSLPPPHPPPSVALNTLGTLPPTPEPSLALRSSDSGNPTKLLGMVVNPMVLPPNEASARPSPPSPGPDNLLVAAEHGEARASVSTAGSPCLGASHGPLVKNVLGNSMAGQVHMSTAPLHVKVAAEHCEARVSDSTAGSPFLGASLGPLAQNLMDKSMAGQPPMSKPPLHVKPSDPGSDTCCTCCIGADLPHVTPASFKLAPILGLEEGKNLGAGALLGAATSVCALPKGLPLAPPPTDQSLHGKEPAPDGFVLVKETPPSHQPLLDNGVGSAPYLNQTPKIPLSCTNHQQTHPRNYSKAVQGHGGTPQMAMKLKYHQPLVEGNRKVVTPPPEVAAEGCKMWEDCLVGYMIDDKRLPFSVVNSFAHRVWGTKGLREVLANDNGFFFFKFQNTEACTSILEAAPWLFAGKPLFLMKWKQGMVLTKKFHSKIPIWAKFYNIPHEYWIEDGLS